MLWGFEEMGELLRSSSRRSRIVGLVCRLATVRSIWRFNCNHLLNDSDRLIATVPYIPNVREIDCLMRIGMCKRLISEAMATAIHILYLR